MVPVLNVSLTHDGKEPSRCVTSGLCLPLVRGLETVDQGMGSVSVVSNQTLHVEPFHLAIDDAPLPADHDPVCAIRTAQQ